jgi:hypothetical protein
MFLFYERNHPGFFGPLQIGLSAHIQHKTDSLHFSMDVALTDAKLLDVIHWNFTPHPSPFEPPGRSVNFGRVRATILNKNLDTLRNVTLSYQNIGCPTFCPYGTYFSEQFEQLAIASGATAELTTKNISVPCTESEADFYQLFTTIQC